ncbi:MAG: RES domain-containing protein [Acidimicrobiales bacterium]
MFRADRSSPWWFASAPGDARRGGRFDLPAPDGSCYLATSPAGAALEAFQDFGRGVLPASELQGRARAEVVAPEGSPPAVQLTAARARAVGVTQALWAGENRALTQRWAIALRRAGWLALWHGTQHDPTGQTRGVTLFDTAGEHRPYDDPGWVPTVRPLAGDQPVLAALARYGIQVIPDPDPATITLDDSGLV